MRKGIIRITAAAWAILFLAGCNTAVFQSTMLQVKAHTALQSQKYDEAVALYEEILKGSPENAAALRGIGRAFVETGRGPEAVQVLEKAKKIDPQDRNTDLYLGMAYSLTEEYGKAFDVWKAYTLQEPDSHVTARIVKQMTVMLHKEASRWAKEAVKGEKALKGKPGDPDTVAVTTFGDRGIQEQIRPLRKAMADMIITDLSSVPSIQVVERVRMQMLLDELKLGKSGVVDSKTAPRVGRFLGAGRVVTGNMAGLSEAVMRVDTVVMDLDKAGNTGRREAQGPVDEFFKIEKTIVFGILKEMGIPLTEKEKTALGRYATTSFTAIKYYGEGLDAQDRGDWDEAIRRFLKSAGADSMGPGAKALQSAPSKAEADATALGLIRDVTAASETDAAADKAAKGGGGGC
jgi:tetratricopeptide (TPR) repeat protein